MQILVSIGVFITLYLMNCHVLILHISSRGTTLHRDRHFGEEHGTDSGDGDGKYINNTTLYIT